MNGPDHYREAEKSAENKRLRAEIETRQQMLMRRPWDAAECESFWVITGARPNGDTFTECLAVTLPHDVTGSEKPLFMFVGALAAVVSEPIDPGWITHAIPLLLVVRDDPATTYWREDQVWITDWQARQ